MQLDRKDIGYTIYSRLEEALRSWIRDVLLNFGKDWPARIPSGVWEKAEDRSPLVSSAHPDDPAARSSLWVDRVDQLEIEDRQG